MTTPSNNQDPANSEAFKPTLFQTTNLFKTSNPFPIKADTSSGGLFNSAASNISQQDGKKGLFGDDTNHLFNQGNTQPTTSSLFGARPQPQKEGSKQEDKTNAPSATGTLGSTNWPNFNKTQGESTKQESTSTSGGILNLTKPSEKQETKTTGLLSGAGTGLFSGSKVQSETPKQETKTDASATGIFGATTGRGLFDSNKTPTQGEAQKQENSLSQPAAGGLFGSIPTKTEEKPPATGGLFGSITAKTENKAPAAGGLFGSMLTKTQEKQEIKTTAPPANGFFNPNATNNGETKAQKASEKEETQTFTPPVTGLFAGGGLFGGVKAQTEVPKQEDKTSAPPAIGGGLFGLNKTQGEPAKQETTGIFGGKTLTIGATTGTTTNSQTSSTMFQAREAPAKKRKDEMSTLSPEKKTTGLNISGLPTTGVQSALFSQPSKTPTLFGQPAKEEPKESQPQAPVDDSKLDAILEGAIAKEEKITQKIKDITSKMNNAQVVDQFLKEQNQAIDEFYAEFTQNLVKRVAEISNQQKQALKNKLSEEVQEFKNTTEELTGHFNKLLAENSLATIKDQLLSAAAKKKDAEQAVKAALATSFELENGFSPLVKKYKAIKYTIPSLNLLSKPIDRQPASKQVLLQKAEVVLPELEKVIEDINLALIGTIGSLSHPLKAYLPKISKCVELENSLLAPDFPFELPGVSSEENPIPRDSKIREVVYKLHKNEAEKLRGLNILSKDGEEELVLRVKPVSVRYDIVPGDLMLVNQAPCEIKSKNSPQGTNDIEFELENVLTGIPQSEKLHSKWDQVHELVLTESFVLVKPNNSQKGYYTLMNLKDSKSTRGLVKAIKTDRTLNDKLSKELETILAEEKRALVQVLRINDEDIIVSCKKLRK